MAQTVCVIITKAEKARLRAISEDRARPLKHNQRARIVLPSAERLSVLEVAHQGGSADPQSGAGSGASTKPAAAILSSQAALSV